MGKSDLWRANPARFSLISLDKLSERLWFDGMMLSRFVPHHQFCVVTLPGTGIGPSTQELVQMTESHDHEAPPLFQRYAARLAYMGEHVLWWVCLGRFNPTNFHRLCLFVHRGEERKAGSNEENSRTPCTRLTNV